MGTDAQRDDRFAEGEDDDEVVALGEVRRASATSPPSPIRSTPEVEHDRDSPEHGLRAGIEERRGDEETDRHGGTRAEPEHGVPERGIVTPGTRNSVTCASRTTPYAIAKVSPRSPNESGTASAATTSALIAANITIRTEPSSGSITFVNHA